MNDDIYVTMDVIARSVDRVGGTVSREDWEAYKNGDLSDYGLYMSLNQDLDQNVEYSVEEVEEYSIESSEEDQHE